jgi:uncharacterized protein YdhG (YjbR/CyaY superfamily)
MRAGVKMGRAFVAVDRSVRFAKCGKIRSAPLPNGVDRGVRIVTDEPSGAKAVDEYIAAFPADVRKILEKIRRTVRKAAPDAEETLSYRIPAFKLNGVLVYFAAFKNHIGLYPPVTGDAKLLREAARYAGEKGNLRFPLDQPIPYDLIDLIVRHKVKENLAKPAARKRKKSRL